MTEGSGEAEGSARIVVDGRPIPFHGGDSVALAILRAGEQPAQGGTLCLAGDCGNCLATVDGVAYVRTCQVAAVPGRTVVRHPRVDVPPRPDQMPPL
ncbi:MAG: 2Fe-2S iron-sulfur cluster binding domain, partial [Chloroflexota bacterium]|nr:2Fe-2S iron-sulfur cluster binding domain [Chloroflexota bacterium]